VGVTHFPLYFGTPGGIELFSREVLPAFPQESLPNKTV
jgi:hypothetical protein